LGGKAHTVEIMINELGADPNHQDSFRQTPLHCAAFVGSHSCCLALIALKCNIETTDLNGNTFLDIAKARGKHKLVELLEQSLNDKTSDTLSSD
jgi:ankyrin repeat protein